MSSPSADGDSSWDRGPVTATRRAVLYLRVSTPSQVKTDYDPEGISIPAQRQSAMRKAEQMGLEVVDEYIEPGKTATSMDKRVAFQAMLQRIRTQRDVDCVIVYKLSRMNRNRFDDAVVMMELRQYGASLISATESIDDTPVGQLMHGMLATFNEYRSAEDGADIRYKMGEKAKKGGTLGRAPLGYLNVREMFEGREVRSVTIDPERGDLVRTAFELYATGDYSLDDLVDELTNRGLRTRPSRFPAGPISNSQLARLLRDPYYVGLVVYKGEVYQGRHEALITQKLFDQVQVAMDARRTSGERRRTHEHYLKGTIYCEACRKEGRLSRLIINRAEGRGGEYFYFLCTARQRGKCSLRHLRVEDVEEAVVDWYATVRLDEQLINRVRVEIQATLADQKSATVILHRQTEAQLAKLAVQEENLIDLASDGAIPAAKVRQRLLRIAQQREKLRAELAVTGEQLGEGAEALDAALTLLENPQAFYRSLPDAGRRLLNQGLAERLYIGDGTVESAELLEPFAELVDAQHELTERPIASAQDDELNEEEAGVDISTSASSQSFSNSRRARRDLIVGIVRSEGWSKRHVVEEMVSRSRR